MDIENRYIRQVRFPPLGIDGQRRILESTVLVCGCGALGSRAAELLVRAGVGRVRLVDRDFVELSNLQRQTLFDEEDAARGLPKSIAAAAKLRAINSQVNVEPVVADVDAGNLERLLEGVDLIVDGTDNFETRLLLNDAAIRFRLPWIFGGCVGAEGQTMTIVPGETPCLACLVPEPPPPGEMPTCDTAGIIAPIVGVIASIEAAEAMKILSGNRGAVRRSLARFDLWSGRMQEVAFEGLRAAGCRACGRGEFDWLDGRRGAQTAVLCGRGAVQIRFSEGQEVNLAALATRLSTVGRVAANPYLVRLFVDSYEITVFADGRAIIGGVDDAAQARSVFAQYVGT